MQPITLFLICLPVVSGSLLPLDSQAQSTQGRKPVPARQPVPGRKPTQTRPRPVPHNDGWRADSLNGIPGHAFGEPRSNFPELVTKGYLDLNGYMYYAAKPGAETGWFGKNSEHVQTTYRFYQDQFASFDASAFGSDRPLLAEQTRYLFGKGRQPSPNTLAYGQAAMNWNGKLVEVELSSGQNVLRLYVSSKVIAARKVADAALQLKREAAERAAKLRADNAPAAH